MGLPRGVETHANNEQVPRAIQGVLELLQSAATV
jgi:hypothetical protein